MPVTAEMFGGAAAFLLTLMSQRLLTPLAERFALLDHPVGRKDHAYPTPITGGIAILAGALLAEFTVFGDNGRAFHGFYLAALVLTTLGVLDDK